MSNDEIHESDLRRSTKIVIDASGEYITEKHVERIISHPDIEIPIPVITRNETIRRVLFPDIVDLIMFSMTFLINDIIFGGMTGWSVFDPRMIVTWGYISLLFVIPGLYRRSMSYSNRAMTELELRKGGSVTVMTDLRLSGLVGSLLLILTGYFLQF